MQYKLIDANLDKRDKLIKYKLDTIFEYANGLSKKEKDKITDYVNQNIDEYLNQYKVIIYDNRVIGGFLIRSHLDGVLLDEIYIENEYRNRGIGKNIINDIISKNNTIYLWVYKKNIKAISLYNKLGFKIIEKTDTRYFMKYNESLSNR